MLWFSFITFVSSIVYFVTINKDAILTAINCQLSASVLISRDDDAALTTTAKAWSVSLCMCGGGGGRGIGGGGNVLLLAVVLEFDDVKLPRQHDVKLLPDRSVLQHRQTARPVRLRLYTAFHLIIIIIIIISFIYSTTKQYKYSDKR